MAEKITQTVDLRAASEKVRAFVINGYRGLQPVSAQENVYVHEYEPGSPTKGPISAELLPMQVGYFIGEKVAVESDPVGCSLVVRPVFADAVAAKVVSSAPAVVPSGAILPPGSGHHPQPVASA